jgi:hypothetical protein
MWEVAEHFSVRLGGNTYIDCKNLIVVRGQTLFTLKRHENGYLGIYFDIYDKNGNRVAAVKRNEIYLGNKQDYTIEGTANRYVVTHRATGRVICDIRKREDAEPAELDISVQLYTPAGFLLDATPEQTNLPGFTVRDCVMRECGTGIEIE